MTPYGDLYRNCALLRQMLETDPNYHLFIARHKDSLVGFSLLYTFTELGVGLLDFMAIGRGLRGQNMGGNLFRYTEMLDANK